MSTKDELLFRLRERRKAAMNLIVSDTGHDRVNRAEEVMDYDERIEAVEKGEPRCRSCGSGAIRASWRQWMTGELEGLTVDDSGDPEADGTGSLHFDYGYSDSGDADEDDEYSCAECGLVSPNLKYLLGLTDQERTARESLEEYANLVFNIGTIIENRRDGIQPEEPLWSYLADNLSEIYDRVGAIIDSIEDEVFGDIREEDE